MHFDKTEKNGKSNSKAEDTVSGPGGRWFNSTRPDHIYLRASESVTIVKSRRNEANGGRGRAKCSRAGLRRVAAAFFCAAAAAAGCASAPKYRSGPAAIEPRRIAETAGRDSTAAITFALKPPVRDFRCGRIKSPFGPRGPAAGGAGRVHEGIDIETGRGEAIVAAAAGTVSYAGRRRGYGTVVIIDHPDGISTVYGHLSYLTVRSGRRVSAGERIGGAGKRGRATGIHLHFEIRREGRPIDPRPYLCLASEPLSP